MSEEGPRLIRPIPRRPFDFNRTNPTPPEDDSSSPSPNPEIDLSKLYNGPAPSSESGSGSIPRAQSVLNLTGSTLFGIYSPTSYGKDRCYNDRDEPETPWGTGAQTPIKRASVDDTTFELMKDRSNIMRRQSSYRNGGNAPSSSTAATALFTISRVGLLFVIGMGYGMMVTRLQDEHRFSSFQVETMIKPGYDWQYLTLWGLSGVVLGGLLPWFDGVWEDTFGKEEQIGTLQEDVSPVKDWALVVRSIGAFVGIVFAIRKLPWASTLQVSLTLALVNPFLWYLIDRSKPGFLLSAAVGLAGSAMLMGINPDVMPTPSSLTYRNESERAYSEPVALGGLASQKTIETGIWMLSVLFCSCVCFGNIGRRLALNKSATARGRWAGIR
ncbi:Putative insulin-induced protein family [Colletotrichum destructivum]|uniref:Insulin-induced protein family n=1 Tax=Colletotrichum destructivum TaxID=34406 RepID=A0AAX4HXB8_9PEZI|nr:Putative insulin-induced protein family [Colletotrichum destructivum]